MTASPATAVEKIIGRHAGKPVIAGELIVAGVDTVMATDGNAPLSIRLLRDQLKAPLSFDGSHIVLVVDHCAPAPDEQAANMQATMRRFADASGAVLYDAGKGISHLVLPEHGHARPGGLVVGSDSHTLTYGALNCLGTGMGSTDIAVAMLTRSVWLRVPETIRVELHGELGLGVEPKDAAFELLRTLGVDGATYKCVEFDGPGLRTIAVDGRFTIANMTMELGAKCALMPADEVCLDYLATRVKDPIEPCWSDYGCRYEAVHKLDLSAVEPLVAVPHDMTELVPADQLSHPIDVAFLGTCTNGRLSDFVEAAALLRGRRIHSRVRLIVTPGSREVYLEALRLGLIETFVEAGAIVTPPGCGPCVGAHMGVPADGEVVITSGNRNFRGRMGNRLSSIYVASAGTVAASAVVGRIASPLQALAA
jgi:3-isopropylmalate/(R)-2-methylmalate dehydratase large subunit